MPVCWPKCTVMYYCQDLLYDTVFALIQTVESPGESLWLIVTYQMLWESYFFLLFFSSDTTSLQSLTKKEFIDENCELLITKNYPNYWLHLSNNCRITSISSFASTSVLKVVGLNPSKITWRGEMVRSCGCFKLRA